MTKRIAEHAAQLTESLLRYSEAMPDAPDFPMIAQGIRVSRERLLRALLDADVDWDTDPSSPYARYVPLMEQADKAHHQAAAIAMKSIPKAEKKEVRKRIVQKIDTSRPFASAYEFRRAAEKVNDIRTKYFTEHGEPKLSTPMMLDTIAEFCSVYLSLSRDELAALPATDKERRRSLDWYDRFHAVAENIRDADSSKEWLEIIYNTPGNPNLLKDWDKDEGDAE